MRQNNWAGNVGLAALLLFIIVVVSTVLFVWLGPLLPSPVHTHTAVPIMLLLWFGAMPLSLSSAVAACTDEGGRSLGIKTLVGHLLVTIVVVCWIFIPFFIG